MEQTKNTEHNDRSKSWYTAIPLSINGKNIEQQILDWAICNSLRKKAQGSWKGVMKAGRQVWRYGWSL